MTRPLALVTGATGAVGPSLVRLLALEGWRVRAVARAPPAPGLLPPDTEIVAADVQDRKAMASTVEGVDAVFHLAAKLHLYDPGAETLSDYRGVNVEGTRVIVEAARAAGVPRMVALSTANLYGPSRPGSVHTETSPLRPASPYEVTKAEAEAIAREHPGATVLRPVAVYGPHMRGNYRSLAQAIQRGRFVPVGPGTNRRSIVHEQDLARACVAAVTHPRAAGRTYNVTDGQLHEFRDIVSAISRASGRSPPRLWIPVAPVRWGVRMASRAFRLAGRRAPLTRDALDKLVEDMAVSGDLFRKDAGYEPTWTLERGWAATLATWQTGPVPHQVPGVGHE